MNEFYEILDWDSNFFGFPVARILIYNNTPFHWKTILSELKQRNVKLVYWPVNPGLKDFQLFAVQNGGKLVDLKTTYYIYINDKSFPKIDIDENIKPYTSAYVAPELLSLGVQCGTYSRYAVDENIDKLKYRELYELWVINSIKKEIADEVFVYQEGDRILGLITVYIKNSIGNIGLIGVDEKYRGKGIGKKLIYASLNYFMHKNVSEIQVVTQGKNISACKLYESCGFKILNCIEFYHFWL